MTTTFISFKKSFVGTSLNGKLFHWLKCTYGETVNEAVDDAVRLIYGPSALVAASESWSMVKQDVVDCREVFQEMMDLVSCSPASELPVPGRVTIWFGASVDPTSKIDNTYKWLFATYGDKAVEVAIHAVHVVYLPAVLAASPELGKNPILQIQRSRIVFEKQIRKAVEELSPNDSELLASRLEQVFRDSPSEGELDTTPPALLQDSAEELEEEFDDDYVPVDRDIDF
ncbi:MAG: hypothetical protein HC852_11260 [Acaryochloridaceae cyanobacterium RU_4_10]|nr:hypothetical protein [Acaryochloridaceae cyanobacterium RU_4_10]